MCDGVTVTILVFVTVSLDVISGVTVGCEGDIVVVTDGLVVVDGVLRNIVGELVSSLEGLAVSSCEEVMDGVIERRLRLGVQGVTDTCAVKEGVTLFEPRDLVFVGPDREYESDGVVVTSGDTDVVNDGDHVSEGVTVTSRVALVVGDRDDSMLVDNVGLFVMDTSREYDNVLVDD